MESSEIILFSKSRKLKEHIETLMLEWGLCVNSTSSWKRIDGEAQKGLHVLICDVLSTQADIIIKRLSDLIKDHIHLDVIVLADPKVIKTHTELHTEQRLNFVTKPLIEVQLIRTLQNQLRLYASEKKSKKITNKGNWRTLKVINFLDRHSINLPKRRGDVSKAIIDYCKIFEHSNNAWILHNESQIIEVNTKALDIFGYKKDELTSLHLDDLRINNDSEEESKYHLEELLAHGIYEFKTTCLRKNGSAFPAEVFVILIDDNEGFVMQSIIKDMSDLQETLSEVKYLKNAIDQTANSVVLTDLDGTITYANRRFSEVSGYSNKELVGSNPRVLKSGHQPDTFYKEMWNTLLDQKTWEGEMINKKKDGSEYWEYATITPIMDSQNEITGFIGVKEDITEKRRTAEELSKLVTKLELASEAAYLGYWSYDLNSRKFEYNDVFLKMCGIAKDEFNGEIGQLEELILAEDIEKVHGFIKHILKGEETSQIDYRILRKYDGQLRYFQSSCNSIKNASGEIIELAGVNVDISEICLREQLLKEMLIESNEKELVLKQTNRQLSALIDNTPGVVFSTKFNHSYEVIFISDYIQAISGYNSQEFYPEGKLGLSDIIYPNDKEKVWYEKNLAYKNKKPFKVNYRIITKTKELRWVLESGEFNSRALGSKIKIIDGVMVDVTESFIFSDKLLKESIRAEDHARKVISIDIHDGLQQSLIAAKFNLQAINKSSVDFDEETKNRIHTGFDLLDEGIEITRDLAHTLMPQAVADFGLISAVENMISYLKYDFETNLTHNLDKDERLPSEVEIGLYRIIQESLNNIIKYSKSKHVFISLNKYEENVLTLIIEDDGIGFDVEQEMTNGFGLLSMQSRANSLNGDFSIESNPHNGTQIFIDIPKY